MHKSSRFLCFFFLMGCAAAPAPQPSPAISAEAAKPAAEAPAPTSLAPRPFTAEQIRKAMPTGHELRFRMEAEGKPTTIEHWIVTLADDTRMVLASKTYTEDGKLVEDQGSETSTWTELVGHASFPADKTTVREGEVEVPAGKFPALIYEVRVKDEGGVETVSHFHFAKPLPGPPALLTVERQGKVVRRMILLERR